MQETSLTNDAYVADQRFGFGENWTRFLRVLSADRIQDAEASLRHMLGVTDLVGRTFLDVGCGSGLFSLAATRLGAAGVHSFDYDIKSVRCAEELRRRFPPGRKWTIEQGSVLDVGYLRKHGRWDVVYSWGVLHHTGAMWEALGNIVDLVAPGGTLFVSIYNDQGMWSRLWTAEKRWYVTYPILRPLLTAGYLAKVMVAGGLVDLATGRAPWRRYQNKERGMSFYYDLIDWLGGYPLEVAKPEEIHQFYRAKGFVLEQMVTRDSGCNEFVFTAPRS